MATLATLIVLPLVIYLVFRESERSLRDWLDTDLDAKVRLLESINSRTFLDSHAGRYLQTLREHFHGEALADMLCYVRLNGELALRPLMIATGKDLWQLTLSGRRRRPGCTVAGRPARVRR